LKRKRLRSVTPSETGLDGGDPDLLRSPLAKRKKIASERSGLSKLKEGISASDYGSENGSAPASPSGMNDDHGGDGGGDDDDDEDEEDEDEEFDLDDDFLAGELEEEWT